MSTNDNLEFFQVSASFFFIYLAPVAVDKSNLQFQTLSNFLMQILSFAVCQASMQNNWCYYLLYTAVAR